MAPASRFILGVEDNPASARLLEAVLERGGYSTEIVADGPAALALVLERIPDAVVLDLHLPTMEGREVLKRLRELHPSLPVVMLTSNHDVAIAVECIKLGAFDYLTKPVDADELLLRVGRAVERASFLHELHTLRRLAGDDGGLAESMGGSASIAALIAEVRRVAECDLTVLLQGETGTGKELVARALHHLSGRKGPFVAIDCGAIAEQLLESELFGHERGAFTGAVQRREGLIQRASGGTVLLDEIANLPPRLQAKLLRVLQERQVRPVGGSQAVDFDVRFIAATNENLERPGDTHVFRRDLYFRLAEYTLRLAPLRNRPEDIPHLAQRFLSEAEGPPRRMTPAALGELQRRAWPGNVRQLRNVVRQAAVAADGLLIDVRHLRLADASPAPAADGRALKDIAATAAGEAEMAAIREALAAAGGNRAEAARSLQVDYKTLYLKLKKYRID